jgi:large subunit ribosomal protein L18
MESNLKKRDLKREKRTQRVRKKLRGSPLCPRLSVYKSNQHLSAQLIDDVNGVTLAAYSTMSKDVKGEKMKLRDAAKLIGEKIAAMAKERQVETAIFDRGRYKFHGVIAAMATAAREAGLKI